MRGCAGQDRYSLLGPSVTLREAARELPPILKARRLSLNISLLALLARRYVVDEAVLDQPQ